jgi:3D (Asp-Asp-Asp) domain-containing protein
MAKILKNLNNRKTEIALLFVMAFEFNFPHYAIAAGPVTASLVPEMTNEAVKSGANQMVHLAPLMHQAEPPVNQTTVKVEQLILDQTPIKVDTYRVVKTYKIPVTAYTSTVEQCDSTPCITANGFDLCKNNQENVIAANFLPFGSRVRIPEVFGDRIFTVVDRMNARYYYRADVWMKNIEDAKHFGLIYAQIEVIEDI